MIKVQNDKVCDYISDSILDSYLEKDKNSRVACETVASKGEIIVNGYDINQKSKQAKRQIGYMPENVPLYLELTVKEFVSYMADLKLVKRSEKKAEIDRVIGVTGLKDVQGKLIRNLSRGYRQRVSLAGALVGNPPILILDEPTVGLDPKQVIEIRNLIKSDV